MKMKRQIYFLLAFLVVIAPRFVFASAIHIGSENSLVHNGDQFLVNVLLDAGEDSNAVDGQIAYDRDVFEKVEIYEGNSAVSFWLEAPHEVSPGVIAFAGMTPGGFQGNNEKIFALQLKAKKAGLQSIEVRNAHLYKNDGTGTPSTIDMKALTFAVEAESLTPATVTLLDTESPEDFTPIISNDEHIFGGKNFLVFGTQDKGLGIDHYEVREGLLGFFKRAESPHLLARQNIDRPIYIRAIDKEGNTRDVVVAPRIFVPIWKQVEWIGLFVVVIFLFQLLRLCAQYKVLHRFKRLVVRSVRGS
jgi:hypothetical protein